MPTPIPVCTQKIKLSISPGISPPINLSRTGVNHGVYSLPVTSSTIWLPASSLPPNSAPFLAIKGTIISRRLTMIKIITSVLLDFLLSGICFLLSHKSDRAKFRCCETLHAHDDQYGKNSFQDCKRQLRRRKNAQEFDGA